MFFLRTLTLNGGHIPIDRSLEALYRIGDGWHNKAPYCKEQSHRLARSITAPIFSFRELTSFNTRQKDYWVAMDRYRIRGYNNMGLFFR